MSDRSHRRERLIDAWLWGLTLTLTVLTLLFSFVVTPPQTGTNVDDRVGHAVAYFATFLSFLFVAVWRPGRGDGPLARKAFASAAVVLVAGIMIEVFQELLLSDRQAELADVVAEVVAVILALSIHITLRRLG